MKDIFTKLPLQTQFLCDQYLAEVKSDPQHCLLPTKRFNIYQSFGTSNFFVDFFEQVKHIKADQITFSIADLAFSWLTVVTAKKLSSIWEQHGFDKNETNSYDSYNPFLMIQEVEKILTRKINVSEGFRILNSQFYDNLTIVEMNFTEKMNYAIFSAYEALRVTLLGREELQRSDYFETADEEVNTHNHDFARLAVKAYTAVDDNEPGAWGDSTFSNVSYKPLKYPIKTRLEFWEWWLTEAIPQAWQLAQETTAK
jgi:hypothetical protein